MRSLRLSAGRGGREGRTRRGIVTVELLMVLPIFLLALVAVVEFAQILMVAENVAYSSRFGAKLASEEPRAGVQSIDNMNLQAGGSRLRNAIDEYLAASGIDTGACRVILDHNLPEYDVGNDGIETQVDPPVGCDCESPAGPLPPGNMPNPQPPSVNTVRVTVCVPLEGNVPDLLGYVGFGLDEYTIEQSATFRYEN